MLPTKQIHLLQLQRWLIHIVTRAGGLGAAADCQVRRRNQCKFQNLSGNERFLIQCKAPPGFLGQTDLHNSVFSREIQKPPSRIFERRDQETKISKQTPQHVFGQLKIDAALRIFLHGSLSC